MFDINGRGRACRNYYTYIARSNDIGVGLLLTLLSNILHALKYFNMYKLAGLMGSAPVLTVMPLHWCVVEDREKTGVKHGFVFYAFPTGEVYSLKKESVQAKKCVRGVDDIPNLETLTAVPLTFRARVFNVTLALIRQDYDDYCGWKGNCVEHRCTGTSGGVNLDALFDMDLL